MGNKEWEEFMKCKWVLSCMVYWIGVECQWLRKGVLNWLPTGRHIPT